MGNIPAGVKKAGEYREVATDGSGPRERAPLACDWMLCRDYGLQLRLGRNNHPCE
jgi:hypothetical protein